MESASAVARDRYLVDNLKSDYRARHRRHKNAARGDVTAWKPERHRSRQPAGELRSRRGLHVHRVRLDPTTPPIDVVLAGVHPVTGEPSYIAVELKQWSDFGVVEGDPAKVWIPEYRKAKPHPAVQADTNRVNLSFR